MKTVSDIKYEINDLIKEIKQLAGSKEKKDNSLRKRLLVKLSQLNQFVLYLESDPTEEYLKKEAKRIKNDIANIYSRYEEPISSHGFTKKQLTTAKKNV